MSKSSCFLCYVAFQFWFLVGEIGVVPADFRHKLHACQQSLTFPSFADQLHANFISLKVGVHVSWKHEKSCRWICFLALFSTWTFEHKYRRSKGKWDQESYSTFGLSCKGMLAVVNFSEVIAFTSSSKMPPPPNIPTHLTSLGQNNCTTSLDSNGH